MICHSGGAIGSDTYWEEIGKEYGVVTKAYSYKTKYHTSNSKVEISDEDYNEGIIEINKANKFLNRTGISKYMNLLARNWSQVKYSQQIFAIGSIVHPGETDSRGYVNKSKLDIVSGGTGYAIMMGIVNKKVIFVFDQTRDKWFRWSYVFSSFIPTDIPNISVENFAGIGTREIKENGIDAIKSVYKLSFS